MARGVAEPAAMQVLPRSSRFVQRWMIRGMSMRCSDCIFECPLRGMSPTVLRQEMGGVDVEHEVLCRVVGVSREQKAMVVLAPVTMDEECLTQRLVRLETVRLEDRG